MIKDLVPMLCRNCIDMKDAMLEYPTDSPKSVTKTPEIPMTCTDSTCTVGKWTNCIDNPSTVSRATQLFNSYKTTMRKANRTLLTVAKNETLCGESNQLGMREYNLSFNSNTYCDTESDTPSLVASILSRRTVDIAIKIRVWLKRSVILIIGTMLI